MLVCFFFSSRRRHTRCSRDWSSDVCSSDLLLFGGRRTFGGRAGTEAALNFGLDVAAQSFRNDARGSKFAKVGDGELWQVRKNGGQRCVGLAKQSDSNVVGDGPFAVLNDCWNYCGWQLFAGKSFQDLRFGEIGIVENHGEHLRMTFCE